MPKLLSDEQVQSFVRDGYIVINAPNAPNAKIFESAQSMMPFRGDGGDANPNDFIDRVIPELTEVWGSPEVHGALCSILGNDYIQHAHRHLHERLPGQDLEDQDIHVDGTVGVTAAARAQLEPWFVIGFYYPQKTTVDMGPTAVVGGTHLLDHVPIGAPAVQDAIWRPLETKLECEAGTVVLCDFRLVHKGCGNVSDKSRFMFKYNFFRTAVDPQPSWSHDPAAAGAWQVAPHPALPRLTPVCRDIWNGFMLGPAAANAAPATASAKAAPSLNLLLPPDKAASEEPNAVELSDAPAAEPLGLIELESEQAVQARLGALEAAHADPDFAAALIDKLVESVLSPQWTRCTAPVRLHVSKAGRVCPVSEHDDDSRQEASAATRSQVWKLPPPTTALAIAIAIGRLAALAPVAAAGAFGRMLLSPESCHTQVAAVALAGATVRLQRGKDSAAAEGFLTSAVLLLVAALGRAPPANMDNQIQNALVTAIGQALSVVPADDVARCAARTAPLRLAALAAVKAALHSGVADPEPYAASAVSSDAVLAIGRIGSAAAAAAAAGSAPYQGVAQACAQALRDVSEHKPECLDDFSSEIARRLLQRWDEVAEAGMVGGVAQEAPPQEASPPPATQPTLAAQTVVVLNLASGAFLTTSTKPKKMTEKEKKADYSKGKKARALDGTPLARLSALVTDLSDADGAAKHAAGVAASAGDATFELRPTGDDDGSVFLVQLSSGRPLHLDGFGDGLASTRYDCLDDFAKFVLETAPGDGGASGCVYLTCVANGMPLHANGLGDKLVSMRHGDIRDDWAQWVLQVVDSDA